MQADGSWLVCDGGSTLKMIDSGLQRATVADNFGVVGTSRQQ
jgi:hypothetical protein